MSEIRILIVDDHSLFREGLSRLLKSAGDFDVVGECKSIPEALASLSSAEADVVLLDYDLGGEMSEGALAELKQSHSAAKVLFVTAGMPDAATSRVMDGGASGIFLKQNNVDSLMNAIRRVAAGEVWIDSNLLKSQLSGRATLSNGALPARVLTARQMEVLRGILDGLTNKEIAVRLTCSESAVKAVIQELFFKAGVRTRSQLVRIAIERHSIDWFKSAHGAQTQQ